METCRMHDRHLSGPDAPNVCSEGELIHGLCSAHHQYLTRMEAKVNARAKVEGVDLVIKRMQDSTNIRNKLRSQEPLNEDEIDFVNYSMAICIGLMIKYKQ